MTRGPLTPAVYWRRRVFVLGVVAALLLIAVNLVRGNDGTPDAATVTASTVADTPGTTPSTTPTTSTTKGAGTGRKPGKGKRSATSAPTTPAAPVYTPPPAPVLVDPVGTCADDDIAVSPTVVGAVAGRTVTITLRLRTIAAEACTWPISADHLALKITEGDEEIWTSRECPGRMPAADVVVRRAVTSTYALAWNARQSDVGCPRLTAFAEPGDYDVEAAAYGGEPSGASFTLAAPVAVAPPADTGDNTGKNTGKNTGTGTGQNR